MIFKNQDITPCLSSQAQSTPGRCLCNTVDVPPCDSKGGNEILPVQLSHDQDYKSILCQPICFLLSSPGVLITGLLKIKEIRFRRCLDVCMLMFFLKLKRTRPAMDIKT